MLAWDTLKTWTREVAFVFQGLATSSQDTPLIGNWCYVEFSHAYAYLMNIYAEEARVGYWLDSAESRLAQILSWATIKANILSSWSWLNTIDDKIWWRAYSMVTSYWSWLNSAPDSIWSWVYPRITSWWPWINSIDDRIWSTAYSRILGAWSWLNTIDDRIVATVTARWSWLNTIDDRIRDVAWNHVRPQLADWFWSFIVLEVTLVSRIGYRVLATLWNMEWDDKNKEAK